MGAGQRFAEAIRRRAPIIAAVANAMFWGLGYLMSGRRRFLGGALCFWVLSSFWSWELLVRYQGSIQVLYTVTLISTLSMLLVSIALARDVYIEVKSRQKPEPAGAEKSGGE